MKGKEIMYVLVFIFIVGVAIGAEKIRTSFNESSSTASDSPSIATATVIPQLTNEGREQAATMVLLGAPPMQPADHIERWNPELHHESCMTCHANPATGARTLPENHYYDNDRAAGKVFRDNCIQCHATQNDTKSAFNDEE